MIFMSQSGIIDPSRDADWAAWYLSHLEIMVTVPGIASAQRFMTSSASHSPSLAMYSVASADVFQDPYYLSVRGMGEWLPLIDRRYYKRNLFDSASDAPDVGERERLLVADRDQPEAGLGGVEWQWLECVGIDRSTPYRGIAIVPAEVSERVGPDARIAVYAPATVCYKKK
jgi:hypothetical protein